jgi:hypothetical protein
VGGPTARDGPKQPGAQAMAWAMYLGSAGPLLASIHRVNEGWFRRADAKGAL